MLPSYSRPRLAPHVSLRPRRLARSPTQCETDLAEDLKRFDVPTLILHGDDDQIVPIGASAMLSSKLFKGSTLKVYGAHPTASARR